MPASLRSPCPTRYRMVFGRQPLGLNSQACGIRHPVARRFFRKGKEPVIRLWRHPLINPIFRRYAVSTPFARENLPLVTLPSQGPSAISPRMSMVKVHMFIV